MDLHKLIGYLPKPKKGFVLPNHKYTGPYNPLAEQLDKNDLPIIGQEPFNAVDKISMKHDICYRDNDNKRGKKKCDEIMLKELTWLEPKNLREKIDKHFVKNIIASKKRLGLGVKWTDQLADELHKPIMKKFKKRIVIANNVDDIWSADLVEMIPFAKYNKGYKYILMVIDLFSRYGWAVPLKTKTGREVADTFKSLIKNSNHKPAMLWVDHGREFWNKNMQDVLKKNDIKLYTTENEEKASVVERWNRTIKTRMWKYFTANNTKNYINKLDELIERYNNTYHRSIGCTPSQARQPAYYEQVFKNLYAKRIQERKLPPKFKVGDYVRIIKKKKTFEKGFTSNWTEELFTIKTIKETKPPTYTIQDLRGEPVVGTFYEKELQKSSQQTFRIDRIIRKRTRNGESESLVKWRGYSKEFNTWIPTKDLEKI